MQPQIMRLTVVMALVAMCRLANCQDEIQFDGPVPEAQLVEVTCDYNQTGAQSYPPVVFWHGMGDTATGSVTIDKMALERRFPGMRVFSIQIGNSSLDDGMASYFSNMNQQVLQACDSILANEHIKQVGRFNAVGFSQGSQFLRALAQRCPLRENGIKLGNLVSLGGQHQGVYGLPKCSSPMLCRYIRYLLTKGAYQSDVQNHLVQAQYWHDPLREQQYKARNIFLADINNENSINETYRSNLMKLDNFVLVLFEQDEMVIPRESSLFGFYAPGQTRDILPLESTPLWEEDRLGLKQMSQEGRLKIISIPGHHLQYHMTWFLTEIAEKYLVA